MMTVGRGLVLAGVLLVGACGGGDDDAVDADDTTTTATAAEEEETTTTEAATSSTGASTTSTTAEEVDLGQPVLWPAPGEGAPEPEVAAEGFVRILLDEAGGSLGEFAQGDPTSGEVPLFGATEGGGTGALRSTILVRQLGDGWYVIGAVSDDVTIDVPAALAEVPIGPVEVSGTGRGFEGTVVLTATLAGEDGAPLAQEPVIAGSAEALEPYAVTLDVGGADDGDTVAIVATTGIGLDTDAPGIAAVPVVLIAL
jgi:hypothetical protein